MAGVIARFSSVFVPGQLGRPRDSRDRFFKPWFSPPTVNFVFAAKLRASSTPAAVVVVETKPVLFSSCSLVW